MSDTRPPSSRLAPDPLGQPIRPGMFQTEQERQAQADIVRAFETSGDSTEAKLANFPRYIRRSHVTRFLALYEIFKRVLAVKGSVVDCGVYKGFSLMTWAKLSAVLEPTNLTRRVYGFDSFSGFPTVGDRDSPEATGVRVGDLASAAQSELVALIEAFDRDRFLGHIPKIELVVGDVAQVLPQFMESHPHLVVSLLFLDFDLYEPTKLVLETLVPRMPKGAVLAFDELDNPLWPGETLALLDAVGIGRLRIERVEFDPYIGFAVLD